jgi:hypothetical protein
MRTQIVLAVAVGVASPAFAKVYTVDFKPLPMQLSRYDRGMETIDSPAQHAIVRVIEVPGSDKKSTSFEIYVLNRGGQAFVFGPNNIVVRTSESQLLPVVTYEQAMEAERKKRKHEKFWAGVAAFGRTLDASQEGTVEGSGTYFGLDGSGSFDVTLDDPSARMAAEREADRMDRQDQADLQARWAMRAAQHETLLRTTTVDAGRVFGGLVTFSLIDAVRKARVAVPITISVTVAGESHVFAGQLSSSN